MSNRARKSAQRPRAVASKAPHVRRPRPRLALSWLALATALIAGLAWVPSLANRFARDDGDLIPAILRGGRPLLPMLFSDFWSPTGSGSGLWRPFATFTLWLDGRLG